MKLLISALGWVVSLAILAIMFLLVVGLAMDPQLFPYAVVLVVLFAVS